MKGEQMAIWKEKDRWRVEIRFMGQKYHIGDFDTKEKAQTEYDKMSKETERIKSEEKADKEYPLRNNDFAVAAYERGQQIKHICIQCCGGSIQDVRQCNFADCENYKFRPV